MSMGIVYLIYFRRNLARSVNKTSFEIKNAVPTKKTFLIKWIWYK